MTDAPRPTVTIEPPRGLLGLNLGELWEYRYLLGRMALRPIQARYKQTVLGISWAVLKPLATAAVFTVFFGKLLRVEQRLAETATGASPGVSYAVFVFAGLLAWNLAAGTVTGAAGITVGNASLITRVYFPRLLLPLSILGTVLLDFAIGSLVLVALLAWQGPAPGPSVLLLPLVVAGILGCAVGVGALVSALNVRYRDFTYLLPFFVQLWLFMTPVIYPTQVVPERFRWVIALNPMTGLVNAFRSCLLGTPLELEGFRVSCGVALLCLLAGLYYFRQVEDHFADVV